jgi:hypothetical protein
MSQAEERRQKGGSMNKIRRWPWRQRTESLEGELKQARPNGDSPSQRLSGR